MIDSLIKHTIFSYCISVIYEQITVNMVQNTMPLDVGEFHELWDTYMHRSKKQLSVITSIKDHDLSDVEFIQRKLDLINTAYNSECKRLGIAPR